MSIVINDERDYYDLLRWLCGDTLDILRVNAIKKSVVYDFYLLLEANARYIKEKNKQISENNKK